MLLSSRDARPRRAIPVGTVITTKVPSRLDRSCGRAGTGASWSRSGSRGSSTASRRRSSRTSRRALAGARARSASARRRSARDTVYLRRRRSLGALVLRPPDGSLGPQAALPRDARLYLVATAASGARGTSACSSLFRFVTGAGIGGEYAAINSAIDELIPRARPRPDRPRDQRQLLDRRGGRRGAHARAARPARPADRDRLAARRSASARCSGSSSCSCAGIVPESPRWLLTARRRRRSRQRRATTIEARVEAAAGERAAAPRSACRCDVTRHTSGSADVSATLFFASTRGARCSASR